MFDRVQQNLHVPPEDIHRSVGKCSWCFTSNKITVDLYY